MLKSLQVINYGLIDEVALKFDRGFTAITGETGSGKSILLGAFGLLLGERADSKSIKYQDKKCIVEAVFDIEKFSLKKFFEENDLDYEKQSAIRREIAPGGKSRAFINDTPVSLQILKSLGERLVDIHSQHENSILGERSFQFGILDSYAQNEELLREYRDTYKQYKVYVQQLHDLKENEARMKQDLDYFTFQLEELKKANLENIDQSSLEDEQSTLTNAGSIKQVISGIVDAIDGDNGGVLSALSSSKGSLQKISSINKQLEEFLQRIESISIELREITRDLELYSESVSVDPERMEEINDLLGQLFHLQQKHRLSAVSELIELRDQLDEKVGKYASVDDEIARLENEISKTEQTLGSLSDQLSTSRQKASTKAGKDVATFFADLSLNHAELIFELKPSKDFHHYGKEEVQILFRANKGGQLLPIKQVASGGEISRVMLALKASISKLNQLPVLILDEIDQGVSGEVGKKIGIILKRMSEEMQLITITHLPQIAGQAQHHMKVFKETGLDTTTTKVSPLTYENRLHEIAEMLSGKNITKAALENAKELMQ
jgi:DNA repair protein RecN (Recombination protein N)